MEKIVLPKELFTKKARDYTVAVLFLLIFSGFIFFAIRPSLITAVSINKERVDLEKVDSLYENKIMDVAEVQSQVEISRDDLYLLDQAVSRAPEVNKMVEDVKLIADNNNFFITKANIADVDLRKTSKKINSIKLIIEGTTNFEDLKKMIDELLNQRRLKTLEKVVITRDLEATTSGTIRVIMTVDGFYL